MAEISDVNPPFLKDQRQKWAERYVGSMEERKVVKQKGWE